MKSLSQTDRSNKVQQILKTFLQAPDEKSALSALEILIKDFADPIIKSVIRRKLRVNLDIVARKDTKALEIGSEWECYGCGEKYESFVQVCPLCGIKRPQTPSHRSTKSVLEMDAEDVYGDTIASLIEKLWSLRESSGAEPIRDFSAYVAAIALNAFGKLMRQEDERRYRLQNKVRYLLDGRAKNIRGFALWQGRRKGEWLCGFEKWKEQDLRQTLNYDRWLENADSIRQFLPDGKIPEYMPLDELLAYIFDWVGTPMKLDDLISGLIELGLE